MRKYVLNGILLIIAVSTGFLCIYAPVVAVPLAAIISMLGRTRGKIQLSEIAELKAAPGEPPVKGRLWLNGSWLLSCAGCASAEVNLPADLATIRKLSQTKGPFRFKKTIGMDALPKNASRYMFRGSGIAGKGKLRINGARVQETIPGYIPFEVDITEYIQDGAAQLKIEVETSLLSVRKGPGREMGLGPVFCAGIFREMWIDAVGFVEITRAKLVEEEGVGNALMVDMKGNSEYPIAAMVSVSDLKDGSSVASFEKVLPSFKGFSEVTFILPSNSIKPWRPAAPQLYEIKIRIISDENIYEKKTITGLSRVSAAGGSLKINGKDSLLKGVIRSEHYPPYGAAVPGWAAKKDVAAIKEIHMNFVYCRDYPPHRKFFEECDRQGLFVAAEFPYQELKESVGAEEAKEQLALTLQRLEEHPSFLWVTIKGKVAPEELPGGRLREKVLLDNSGGDAAPGTFGFANKLVDMYSPGHEERTVSRTGGAGLVVVDFIDTEAGREPRNKRELRKAALDLSTLKAAERKGVKALVLGRFFTWGLASGIFSINRTKKASAITISSHLQTGGEGEMTPGYISPQLSSRILIIAASAVLILSAILPPWRNIYLTAPSGLPAIQPLWHSALIFVVAQVAGSFGVSIYFNLRRRALTGAAPFMGYSSFMNIYTSDYLRAMLYAFLNLWLVYTGTVAVYFITGMNLTTLCSLVMTAAMFDILLVSSMFSPVRPIISIFCATALQGLFLSYSIGIEAAVLFASIRFIPLAITLFSVERKNIFKM